MTQVEWTNCTDPTKMLNFLVGKVTEEELRLFACACCRRIWHLLTDPRSRRAVEVAELFACGHATRSTLNEAGGAAWFAGAGGLAAWELGAAAWTTYETMSPTTGMFAARDSAAHAARSVAAFATRKDDFRADPWAAVESAERKEQAALLREIMGNVFAAPGSRHNWPMAVRHLAEALSNDNDCGFALHDALLESGHSYLAAHFRQEPTHPKTCWVAHLILQKN